MEDVPQEWENQVVLYLVQALLGLVSTNIYAISVEVRPAFIALHFAVRSNSEEFGEDLSDIIFELDALFDESSPEIRSSVHVGQPDTDWVGRHFRLVYWAKYS